MFKKLLTTFTATLILSLILVSYDTSVNIEDNISITSLYKKDDNN